MSFDSRIAIILRNASTVFLGESCNAILARVKFETVDVTHDLIGNELDLGICDVASARNSESFLASKSYIRINQHRTQFKDVLAESN